MSEPPVNVEETLSTPVVVVEEPNSKNDMDENQEAAPNNSWCNCGEYDGVPEAKGFARLAWGRGAIVMSNLLLSVSLIYLAAEEADCLDEEDTLDSDCENRVYGFKPSSLISNIVIISSVLSSLCLPIVGAILDHTSHRRYMGMIISVIVIFIQAVQIGTVEATWFPMLLLQGLAGFFYEVIALCAFAYLPDIATLVGEERMNVYTSRFMRQQIGSQVSFGIVLVILAGALGLESVQQGQLSQAINTLYSGYLFYIGWNYLPEATPKHELLEGETLLTAGFYQVWQTAKEINTYYNSSLKWFLITVVISEAATNVFTTLAVVFLQEVLDMSGSEASSVFVLALLSSLPGTYFGSKVTAKTDPNTSLKLSLVVFSIVTIIACFVLQDSGQASYSYIFAVLWGVLLGWYYATINMFFSMCVPKNQEAELAGLFMYCTQIGVWFPPLVYTIMNESGVHMKWSLMMISVYLMIGAGTLCLILPWEQALKEVSNVPEEALSRRRGRPVTKVSSQETENPEKSEGSAETLSDPKTPQVEL